jgi:hypothetical protein
VLQQAHNDVHDDAQDDRKEVDQLSSSCATGVERGIKAPVMLKIIFQGNAKDMENVAQALRRGRGRPRKECSLGAKVRDDEEPPDPDKGIVPNREAGNCLDPELPGSGLQEGGKRAWHTWSQEKESVGTQQRWGNHEKRQRGIHSRRDEGGSAANRGRRLLFPLLNNSREVTHSIHV